MKRSAKLNLAAVVALTAAVVLFYAQQAWPATVCAVVGAGFALAAGRVMQREPRRPSPRDVEDD